jgi:hypothetical protein
MNRRHFSSARLVPVSHRQGAASNKTRQLSLHFMFIPCTHPSIWQDSASVIDKPLVLLHNLALHPQPQQLRDEFILWIGSPGSTIVMIPQPHPLKTY